MTSSFQPTFDSTLPVASATQITVGRMTRTGPGMAASQCAYFNVPYNAHEHTTLNEAYSILTDIHHDHDIERYQCGWFSIGVNGYLPSIGSSGNPRKIDYIKQPYDLNLNSAIPLSLRTVDNQLTPEEEEDFFLKTVWTHDDGTEYIAYWAAALDRSVAETKHYKHDSETGVTSEYVYTSDNLAPEPVLPPTDEETLVETGSMKVLTTVNATLTAFMVAEIKNACNIMFGEYLEISEIAFIQAAVRTVADTDGTGTPYNRTELIDATVGMAGSTAIPVPNSSGTIVSEYRLGGAESLYQVKATS